MSFMCIEVEINIFLPHIHSEWIWQNLSRLAFVIAIEWYMDIPRYKLWDLVVARLAAEYIITAESMADVFFHSNRYVIK